jgi:hypothetical protein
VGEGLCSPPFCYEWGASVWLPFCCLPVLLPLAYLLLCVLVG